MNHIMKALYLLPLSCALASLLALTAASSISIVPHSTADHFRGWMILIIGLFLVAWTWLAFQMRLRQQRASVPRYYRRVLLAVSGFYLLAILALIFG